MENYFLCSGNKIKDLDTNVYLGKIMSIINEEDIVKISLNVHLVSFQLDKK